MPRETKKPFLVFSKETLAVELYDIEGWSGPRLDEGDMIQAISSLSEMGYRYSSLETEGDLVTVFFDPPSLERYHPQIFKSEPFG